jgi:dipeptidyl aminopeptidase/acylaminoacyl peptidase
MNRAESPFRTLSADRLTAALDEVGGSARPDYLNDIVAQASRTGQRPAWTFPERWLPMTIALRPAAVPRAYVAFLVLLAALLALMLTTLLLAGASPSVPTAPIVHNGLIAFETANGIEVAQPDGSGQHVLIPGAGNHGPVWSPDGSRLAYESTEPGSWQLIVINADGSQPVTIASSPSESTSSFVAWSPDGLTIAYSARTTQTGSCPGNGTYNGDFCTSRIFLAAADGSGSRQVGDPTLDARSPIWSPDGRTLAFGGGNASQRVSLYLMDAAGTNVREVSSVWGHDWAFVRNSWSYDGSMVASQAGAANGNTDPWDIWTIPVDGSSPTDVGSHPADDDLLPTWAPDRNALAWSWNGHVVLKDVGVSPVDLPPAGGVPFWSPDGTLLATSDGSTLRVLGLDGSVQASMPGAIDKMSWQRLTLTP